MTMTMSVRLHPRLAKCNKCYKYENTQTTHPDFAHCTIVQCVNCFDQWCVCVDHNIRFSTQKLYKLRSHFLNNHDTTIKSNSNNSNKGNDKTLDTMNIETDNVCQFVDDNDDDISFFNTDLLHNKKLKSNNNMTLSHTHNQQDSESYIFSNSIITVIRVRFNCCVMIIQKMGL